MLIRRLDDLTQLLAPARGVQGGQAVHPPWKKSGWAWPIMEIWALVWKLPGTTLSMKVIVVSNSCAWYRYSG